MERPVERVHESSSVAVLEGTEIVYVVRVPTERIMTISLVVAVALVAKGRALGYWLNAVVLEIGDLAFVMAEIVPGHVSVVETGIGPLLYVAALAVTTVALVGDRRHQPASSADAVTPSDVAARELTLFAIAAAGISAGRARTGSARRRPSGAWDRNQEVLAPKISGGKGSEE